MIGISRRAEKRIPTTVKCLCLIMLIAFLLRISIPMPPSYRIGLGPISNEHRTLAFYGKSSQVRINKHKIVLKHDDLNASVCIIMPLRIIPPQSTVGEWIQYSAASEEVVSLVLVPISLGIHSKWTEWISRNAAAAKNVVVLKPKGTDYFTLSNMLQAGFDLVSGKCKYSFLLSPTHATMPDEPPAVFLSSIFRSMRDHGAAAASCSLLQGQPPVIVDHGVDPVYVPHQTSVYFEREFAGFSASDERTTVPVFRRLLSPYCTLIYLPALFPSSGKQFEFSKSSDVLSKMAFVDVETEENVKQVFPHLRVFGRLNVMTSIGHGLDGQHLPASVPDRFLALSARMKALDKVVEGLTMEEIRQHPSLRESVRAAYRTNVIAESRTERVGCHYNNSLWDAGDDRVFKLFSTIGDSKSRIAALVKEVEHYTTLLVEAAALSQAFLASSDTEETVGWDISSFLTDNGYSLVQTPTRALFNSAGLPPGLVSLFFNNSNSTPFQYPSFQLRLQHPLLKSHPELLNQSLRYGVVRKPEINIIWDTFCCYCCGFATEITHLAIPLQRVYPVYLMQESECYCSGVASSTTVAIERMHLAKGEFVTLENSITIWINHRDPMGHNELMEKKTRNGIQQPTYTILRTMYEFTKINRDWVTAMQSSLYDEIWVTGTWVKRYFIACGVPHWKMHIIPEALDTSFYDPSLPITAKVELPPQDTNQTRCNKPYNPMYRDNFKFLSDFKWEPRKGWDVLIKAYFSQFSGQDNVTLYIITHIWFAGGPDSYGDPYNASAIVHDIDGLLQDSGYSGADPPHLCVITTPLSTQEVKTLYQMVHAFVLPTRGEGWGLPTMQAMSMALPTITTSCGGQSEFVNANVAFLIRIDGYEEIPYDSVYGWLPGKKWCVPNLQHVGMLMKTVFDQPGYGEHVGSIAREWIKQFNEGALSIIIERRINSIREHLVGGSNPQQGGIVEYS